MKKRYKDYRGGYRQNTPSPSTTYSPAKAKFRSYLKGLAQRNLPTKGVAGAFVSAAKMALDTGLPQQFVREFINSRRNNQSPIIPGVGVLPKLSPSTKSTRVTNKGTGVTKTYHKSGILAYNKTWQGAGQKYIRNVTTADTARVVSSNGILKGIVSEVTCKAIDLQINRSLMYSGTGSPGDPFQDVYLSHVGSNFVGNMYLSNTRVQSEITSATNTNIKFRIYELVAKLDTSIPEFREPGTAWEVGVNEAFGTNSVTSYRNPNMFPGHSEVFRTYWNVDSYYDIELPAGGSHVHTSEYNHNLVLPNARFASIASLDHIFAGLTRATLFVLDSAVVHDKNTESLVGYGTTSFDMITSRTYEYYGKPSSTTVINASLTTDTIADPTIITDSDFVDVTINN